NHSIAVLIGDYLFSRAAALAAETGNIRVVNIFSQTLTIICDGELRQHFNRQQLPYSVDDYYRRIFAKTAALFAAATEAGAILSNATQSEIQALRDYGHNVGLAFQIVDDVLDLVGDEDKMGKPAGSDLRQGIITLPMLYFLSQGNDPTTIRRVIDEGHRDAASVQAAINAIRASGAIETALAEARRFSQYAQEALQALPAHPNRQILFDLADFIIQRDY
ncbi:MAG: polyprenyl synthetase family protein, partial [Anaerolineae bacterium]|nr:polyprenyl synthetase family protein [Anaerolineae bacterium]